MPKACDEESLPKDVLEISDGWQCGQQGEEARGGSQAGKAGVRVLLLHLVCILRPRGPGENRCVQVSVCVCVKREWGKPS